MKPYTQYKPSGIEWAVWRY